jgi:hypothetical protein
MSWWTTLFITCRLETKATPVKGWPQIPLAEIIFAKGALHPLWTRTPFMDDNILYRLVKENRR